MDETLEQRSSPGYAVGLAGDIDLANARVVGDDLCRAIDRANGAIIVDLGQVTFIDSSAIAMMVSVHKYASLRDRTVTWQGVQPKHRFLFEIVGVDGYLSFGE
jgi:anti-sigma B factor antagonist